MFMPMQNLCGNFTVNTDKRDPSKVYGLDFPTIIAPGTDKVGAVWAVSAETGRTVWKMEQRAGVLSLVATAGGLIFVGATTDRRFRAFDSKTGKELWSTRLEATVNANPMTYRGKNGKQYVAFVATDTLVAYALP
jgi:glucose dehydrogenase